MLLRRYGKEKFWHRYPKERTFLEKVVRRFTFPRYNDHALTFDGWDRYNARRQRLFPVRWFFHDTLPDWWREYLVWPKNKVQQFFRYRLKDRYHVVNTGLEPGYYDTDTRMINAAFQLLVDYVELELAAMHAAAEESVASESTHSFYGRIKKFRAKQERNAADGLAYLDWEINESAGAHIAIGNYTQADAAKEKKFLYLWWTKYRPERAELYKTPLIWYGPDYDPNKPVFSQDCGYQYHLVQQLERFYEDEDTEMLHRLMNIRKRLWS